MAAATSNAAFEFTCPFCGREAEAFRELEPGRPAVLHLAPACGTFMRLEAGAYLRAVRGRWARDPVVRRKAQPS